MLPATGRGTQVGAHRVCLGEWGCVFCGPCPKCCFSGCGKKESIHGARKHSREARAGAAAGAGVAAAPRHATSRHSCSTPNGFRPTLMKVGLFIRSARAGVIQKTENKRGKPKHFAKTREQHSNPMRGVVPALSWQLPGRIRTQPHTHTGRRLYLDSKLCRSSRLPTPSLLRRLLNF